MRKRRNRNKLLSQTRDESDKHDGLIITPKEGSNTNLTINREIHVLVVMT